MQPEEQSALAGLILSLAFSYLPILNRPYAQLKGHSKRLLMLAGLLVVTFVIYLLACLPAQAGPGYPSASGLASECAQEGLQVLVRTFLAALVANQSTYLISPRRTPFQPQDRKQSNDQASPREPLDGN